MRLPDVAAACQRECDECMYAGEAYLSKPNGDVTRWPRGSLTCDDGLALGGVGVGARVGMG